MSRRIGTSYCWDVLTGPRLRQVALVDWAVPEQSWRWAGPSWTGRVPDHAPGGVTGLTIEVNDPAAAA
jgi:hypothetical protein